MTMAVIVAVSPLSTVKAMENVSDNTLLEEEEDTAEVVPLSDGEEETLVPAHMATKPANGKAEGNPFKQMTAGSNSFRIPAMVTLDSGRLVAAADVRWNTTYDGGGLDTMVSWSDDKGANWDYSIVNYLGDNGNVYNGSSTCFIDPNLITDGKTVWMILDITPYGVASNGNRETVPSMQHTGFDSAGNLLLSKDNHGSYGYYLNLSDRKIYSSQGEEQTGYTVDARFNIFGTDGTNSNLFFKDSPFKVQRTSYLYLIKSENGGESWSEPKLINLKETRENGLYIAPGRGLYTAQGVMIYPAYGFTTSGVERTCFMYSVDKGQTWKRSSDLCSGSASAFSTSESAVIELPGGRLRFFYRDKRENTTLRYADAIPTGSGETLTYTWTEETDTGKKINVDCQMSAITYSEKIEGKQVVILSAPTGPGRNGSHDNNGGATGGRKNGSLFTGLIDHNDPNYAITWINDKYVNQNDAQYMYSCLTEMKDGNIALLYEDNQNGWGTGANYYFTIAYATFNVNELAGGKKITNSKLEAALEKAGGHDRELYTPESYEVLEEVIREATEAKNGIYDKQTLEAYVVRLEEAERQLQDAVPPDTQKPEGPFNLRLEEMSGTTATLSFDSATDDISTALTYDIAVTEKENPENKILEQAGSTALNYQLTGLENGKTYVVSVTAKDEAGNTNTITAELKFQTTDIPTDPTDPTDTVKIPEGLWISGIRGDLTYTGGKITQEIAVYDGATKLTEKVDYTLTYKNNTNAQEWSREGDGIYVEGLEAVQDQVTVLSADGTVIASAEEIKEITQEQVDEDLPDNLKKSPQVIIKMKGNYKGSYTICFEIQKQDINKALADDLAVTYNGKNQTPAPAVTLNGKKLTLNKDYEIPEYLADKASKSNFKGTSDQDTDYPLTLKGMGNYNGEKPIKLTIGAKNESIQKISMSKVKVSGVKALTWVEEIAKNGGMKQQALSVTNGKDLLVDETTNAEKGEFTVVYQNNDKVGTATILLTGNGQDKDGDNLAYIGTKRITFKINGNSMSKVKVENLDAAGYFFTGDEICPLNPSVDGDAKVTFNGIPMEKGTFEIDYEKNISKGTGTIILTGIETEGFSGVKKQTFKIAAATIDDDATEASKKFTLEITDSAKKDGEAPGEITIPFTKGGVKPSVTVTNPQGDVMTEGVDYTVSYKNNKNQGSFTAGKAAPAIVVKGKGNYQGTEEVYFTIIPKDVSLAENADDISVILTDKVENFKKNGWKSSVKVLDQDGKALSAKEADSKNAVYTIESLPANTADIKNLEELEGLRDNKINLASEAYDVDLPAGTVVKVTVKLLAPNYVGEVSGTYKILKAGYDISKAKLVLKAQEYTGKPVMIDEDSDFSTITLQVEKGKEPVILTIEGDNPSLEVIDGSYVKNIKKGTAKVTFRGRGEFGGTKTVSFKIQEKDVTKILEGIFSVIFED